MKRTLILLLIFCLLAPACIAETPTIHNLWELDINSLTVQQIHDFLETEKGILSKIVWNYDNAGHNSLNSLKDQDLKLLGYPFSLHYSEYKRGKSISLNFRSVGIQNDAYTITKALIEKYGAPTLIYYDLYSRSGFEWDNNIGTPMYHKRCVLSTIDNFDILQTLLTWEHYEENDYLWGELQLYVYIDNIEIKIEGHDSGNCTVFISFDSYIPSTEINEVDEAKNIPSYVDTGF